MDYHITGFFWTLDRKAKPFLELTTKNGFIEYLQLKRNNKLNIVRELKKKCTGYFKDGKHFSCPENSELKSGKQCINCRSKDEFNVCASCDGTKCSASEEKMKKCLESTHFLYLALIGDKIKVGITHSGRYLKRWIEQGADYACLINSDNGLNIRAKEKSMASELIDRVSTTEKIKNFMKDDRTVLDNYLKEKNIQANIINVRRFYEGIDCIPKMPCVIENLPNGRIVCVKGKILVYEKEDEYYYYDLNNVIGKEVELEF